MIHIRHIKYFFITFLALFFFGGLPIEFGKENSFFHGYIIPNPVIRIGLGINLRDIVIRSSSGMKVYEVKSGYRLLGDDVEEVRIKGEKEKLTEKFILLIAQTDDKKRAERMASDLKAELGDLGNISVVEEKDAGRSGDYQVRLGDFLTRGDALDCLKKLNARGIQDVWILREIMTVDESQPYWILIENSLQPLANESVLYFIPSNPQSFLSSNGRKYRGIFILRGTPKGIVLINILNLEDYLKGVVPEEMSPDSFGEIEALKAQAVAARTYAIKNMGQNKEFGYDLSDTPSSQVYGGMDSERPLSSRAVSETQGEVIRYRGELINALYMSTCGGMTENVENVFSGRPEPYLKSVECTFEKRPEWTVEGGSSLAPIYVAGRNISPDIAPFIGVLEVPLNTQAGFYDELCPSEEASAWTGQALKLVGKKAVSTPSPSGPLTFLSLAKYLVNAFDWQGQVNNLLLPSEVNFILKDLPGIRVEDRSCLAYCLQQGLFPSLMVGDQKPGRAITRGEVAFALSRILSGYQNFFHEGVFKESSKGTIALEEDGETKLLKLSSSLLLLRNLDGTRFFVSRLALLGGEKVRHIDKDDEIQFLEVIFPGFTNVLDRSSRFNFWRVRKSREELEAMINQYYPIGRLIDVSVLERGISRRVMRLQIVGTEGQTSARGLKVRSILGLRDTLFDVDREYDEKGAVTHFLFSGRGWGHGIGLCQVGAYGMAQAGVKYKDILKKYYLGVRVENVIKSRGIWHLIMNR